MKKNVVIIGAGNVATHLSIAIRNADYNIIQVYSRQIDNAVLLASLLGVEATDNLEEIDRSADIYLIAVSDSAIEKVVAQLPGLKGVVAHTSGSMDMDLLEKFDNYGVFYPFQTFTKEKQLRVSEVPLLLEASSPRAEKVLLELAGDISNKVQLSNARMRKALHISAVFACNFVNHMYALAGELLEKEGLSFTLLEPLIRETTQKALTMSARDAQTGPARRKDRVVMNRHIETLNDKSFHREIYTLVSESIMKMYSE
jgi:predicted short-subunit dehydrogenase-like oxidoreductase (DUF2520 family)